MRPSLLGFLCVAAVASAASAAECPGTGRAAPDVVTLMASPENAASEAWVVPPTCDILKISVDDDGVLEARNLAIERVDSVPSEAIFIKAWDNPLSRSGDFSKATKAKTLFISSVMFKRLDTFLLPPALEEFSLTCGYTPCDVDPLTNVTYPETLETLTLSGVQVSSLKGVKWPRALKKLSVMNAFLESVDDADFQSIEELTFSLNPLKGFNKVKLPPKLSTLQCVECPIGAIQGIKWPTTMFRLNFADSPISTFEIRQSDVLTIAALTYVYLDSYSQGECEDPTANVTAVRPDINVCVISDARFEEKYPPAPTPPPATSVPPKPTLPPQNEGSAGGSEADSDTPNVGDPLSPTTTKSRDKATRAPFGEEDPQSPSSSETKPSSSPSPKITSNKTQPVNNSGATRVPKTIGGTSPSVSSSDSPSAAEPTSTSASSNQKLVVAVAVLGSFCALVALFTSYRLVGAMGRRRKDKLEEAGYSSLGSPNTASTKPHTQQSELDWSRLEALADNFRNDAVLAGFRLDPRDIAIRTAIGGGNNGTVYSGQCRGLPVAIKQLPDGAWRNENALELFMNEIRMCASLEHPKIVKFVGVGSTGLRDLTAVVEFMPGNLHSLIHAHRETSGNEWFKPWTPSQLRSKAQMAADVAEAIVYLHSFNTPIIHRDLKSKNVHLDATGNAKLSNFGVGRSFDVDKLVRGDLGSTAWVAPEVLRGEHYNEKADIYSLGMLLIELDRCAHPFVDEDIYTNARDEDTSVIQTNTRLILLVSSGQLHPKPSVSCPSVVSNLIDRCLSADTSDRPTAMEVFYELRKAQKSRSP